PARRQEKRSSPGSPVRLPPSSTAWRYSMPASARLAASAAWLNCGFRRELGKRRTSTRVSTEALRRQSTSSSIGLVPCPIVKAGSATRIESPLPRYGACMAETLNWDELRELAEFRAEKGCAISFYVDLDPTITPTTGDADARVNALLSEGERNGNANHRGLTHDQRQGLKADFDRIRDFFENEFERDGVRGLAIFSAGLDNVWRPRALLESVPDRVRVGRELHLAPLVPLVGRGEGAIVAVVGRERGDLFRLHSGRLEEIADRTGDLPGRHDQGGWSQARFRRHIEKLVREQ